MAGAFRFSFIAAAVLMLPAESFGQYQPWNNPGRAPAASPQETAPGPAPRRDPTGFPRIILYELRPVQILHTPESVLMLYMFEKRWRVIWTDGRQLPKDPDPRWYGYSVGHWEDDYTLVVETVGMDERTWLDNAGDPQ